VATNKFQKVLKTLKTLLTLIAWDSNIFTVDGFKTMLETLKTKLKLTTLDMQLPHVKKLDISAMGRYSLLDLGVSDRGVQVISQNLNNLTYLCICKQWSDLGMNSIGE
jgi:hypothetical protein